MQSSLATRRSLKSGDLSNCWEGNVYHPRTLVNLLCHLLALWPWASYVMSLGLCFSFGKIGLVISNSKLPHKNLMRRIFGLVKYLMPCKLLRDGMKHALMWCQHQKHNTWEKQHVGETLSCSTTKINENHILLFCVSWAVWTFWVVSEQSLKISKLVVRRLCLCVGISWMEMWGEGWRLSRAAFQSVSPRALGLWNSWFRRLWIMNVIWPVRWGSSKHHHNYRLKNPMYVSGENDR